MKPFPGFVELPLAAAVLMSGMLVVMWAARSGAECAVPHDAARPLVLNRDSDREHLASDYAIADRTARRYMAAGLDGSLSQTRLADCQARLVLQIATRHQLSPDRVRAGAAGAQ
jgi:hypothetical protein